MHEILGEPSRDLRPLLPNEPPGNDTARRDPKVRGGRLPGIAQLTLRSAGSHHWTTTQKLPSRPVPFEATRVPMAPDCAAEYAAV